MNKPISASGLRSQLAIGSVRKEPRIVPRDATGLAIVELLGAEIEGDSEGNMLDKGKSTTKENCKYKNNRRTSDKIFQCIAIRFYL